MPTTTTTTIPIGMIIPDNPKRKGEIRLAFLHMYLLEWVGKINKENATKIKHPKQQEQKIPMLS